MFAFIKTAYFHVLREIVENENKSEKKSKPTSYPLHLEWGDFLDAILYFDFYV